jgi:hypothetical protein
MPASPGKTAKWSVALERAWPGRLQWSAWRSCCPIPERLRQTNADRPAGWFADERYGFTADDGGVHAFTNKVILRKRGTQTLTVTDTLNSAPTATDSMSVV